MLLTNSLLALCDSEYGTNFLYITPTADSYVDSGNPTSNYGTSATLYAYLNSKFPYFKFDLSSIPEDANVVSAKFRFVNEATGNLNLYTVDSNTWDESTITNNNRPLMGDLIDSY